MGATCFNLHKTLIPIREFTSHNLFFTEIPIDFLTFGKDKREVRSSCYERSQKHPRGRWTPQIVTNLQEIPSQASVSFLILAPTCLGWQVAAGFSPRFCSPVTLVVLVLRHTLLEPNGCVEQMPPVDKSMLQFLFLVKPVSDGRCAGSNRVECLWDGMAAQIKSEMILMLGKSGQSGFLEANIMIISNS